jgi:hypothetical protein
MSSAGNNVTVQKKARVPVVFDECVQSRALVKTPYLHKNLCSLILSSC